MATTDPTKFEVEQAVKLLQSPCDFSNANLHAREQARQTIAREIICLEVFALSNPGNKKVVDALNDQIKALESVALK